MKLPPGTDIRMGMHAGVSLYYVFLVPRPREANMRLLDEMAAPGCLSALLTHEAGIDWPDRRGVALAEETLALGSPVILQFARLSDALAAHKRLTAAMAH